jgi:hypothetical protein
VLVGNHGGEIYLEKKGVCGDDNKNTFYGIRTSRSGLRIVTGQVQ